MATQDAILNEHITCIRAADWIIGWNHEIGQHDYLTGGDVAWKGDRLLQVGGHYAGPVTTEIEGAGRVVMPGLINIHCHPSQTAIFRGYVDEFGNPTRSGRVSFTIMRRSWHRRATVSPNCCQTAPPRLSI